MRRNTKRAKRRQKKVQQPPTQPSSVPPRTRYSAEDSSDGFIQIYERHHQVGALMPRSHGGWLLRMGNDITFHDSVGEAFATLEG